MRKKPKTTLGWREWVRLPELGHYSIKAKVDTGARTSALHASNIRFLKGQWIEFTVHPLQDSAKGTFRAKAKMVEQRHVKSSTGISSLRPVIETILKLGDQELPIELTLVNRDMMGFRMLIGRQALRQSFLVDPSQSFLLGRPRVLKKRKRSSKKKGKRS